MGNEVLKCFDLRRYATLFSLVAWVSENPPRHADAHALFPATPGNMAGGGETPLADNGTLLRHVWKESENPRAGNKVGCPLFFLHPPVAMPPAYFPISPKELNGVALILWRSVEVRLGKFVQ